MQNIQRNTKWNKDRKHSVNNQSRPFVWLTRSKKLPSVVIVPTHLNPTNAWRGTHLGDNGACHRTHNFRTHRCDGLRLATTRPPP
jgi:hypothetical protein